MAANRDRLPTLHEVLNRMSAPPVDLWSFHVFMRKRYGGVDYLDFWLDVSNYLALYRQYRQQQRKRGIDPSQVKAEQDTQPGAASTEHKQSPSRSPLDRESTHTGQQARPPRDRHSHRTTVARLSALLDQFQLPNMGPDSFRHDPGRTASPQLHPSASPASVPEEQSDDTSQADTSAAALLSEEDLPRVLIASQHAESTGGLDPPFQPQRVHKRLPSRNNTQTDMFDFETSDFLHEPVLGGEYEQVPGGSPGRTPDSPLNLPNVQPLPNDSEAENEKEGLIMARDLQSLLQRIILRYLTPGSPHEIMLPSNSTGWSMARSIVESANNAGYDDPKVLEEAHLYVFDVLEQEAFPAFLSRRALANVQPWSSALRLICGLLCLFCAFWLSFAFILLDWHPHRERCWVILPFVLGWYLVASSLYYVDPVLGVVGLRENEYTLGVAWVEEHYVRKLLLRRALFVAVVLTFIAACFCVLFILVPGHRL